METYNQHIELINNYLNSLLSPEAKKDFEFKLQNDTAFHTIYEEHLIFIKGLERVQLKDDILKAQRSYLTEKWVKISGISIIAIGILVLLYTLVFKTSDIEPTPKNDAINTLVLDSTITKTTASKTLIDSSEVNAVETTPEVEMEYTSTTIHEKFGSATYTNSKLKKRAQNIRIDVQNDTIITCKEGTVLHIKKGSFINSNTGNIVTGDIELSVTEYYNLSDILMANLSTVSNGKQLETGGMLYIEAKQGVTQLELRAETPMEISFPTQNKKTGMQLFSGEWDEQNINWKLENIEELEAIVIPISEEELEEHIEVPFSVVEQVPTFPGCESDDNETRKKCTSDAIAKFLSRKFNTDVGLGLGLSGKQRIYCVFKIDRDGNVNYIQTRSPHPRLSEEADRVLNLLPQMSPGMQRGKPVTVPYSLPLIFEIEGGQRTSQIQENFGTVDTVASTTSVVFDQRVSNSSVEMDTFYTERRGIVELIREVMHDKDFSVDSLFIREWEQYKKQRLIRELNTLNEKRYVLRKSLFELEGSKFKILEEDSITRGGHVIRIPWDASKIPTTTQFVELIPKRRFAAGTEAITAEEFEARLNNENDVTVSSRDASYYVLKTSNLGWINCDRFINGRTKRIKYKLKIKNADGASVNMVFKSYNSILPSWYANGSYDFQTVGINEPIVLVAIRRKDGKLYYDTVETKTEANPEVDFEFKEVTIEDLKKRIRKIK